MKYFFVSFLSIFLYTCKQKQEEQKTFYEDDIEIIIDKDINQDSLILKNLNANHISIRSNLSSVSKNIKFLKKKHDIYVKEPNDSLNFQQFNENLLLLDCEKIKYINPNIQDSLGLNTFFVRVSKMSVIPKEIEKLKNLNYLRLVIDTCDKVLFDINKLKNLKGIWLCFPKENTDNNFCFIEKLHKLNNAIHLRLQMQENFQEDILKKISNINKFISIEIHVKDREKYRKKIINIFKNKKITMEGYGFSVIN